MQGTLLLYCCQYRCYFFCCPAQHLHPQIKAELAKLPKPAGAAAAAGGPVQQSVEEQQQQHQRPTKRRAGATQSVAAAVHDEDGVIDLT